MIAAMAGFLVLMPWVPHLIPIPSDTRAISAAAARGYNAPVAYWVAVLWSVFVLGLAAILSRRWASATPVRAAGAPAVRLYPTEIVGIFVVFFLAYFPLIVARYGPMMEDHGFIVSLFRMACGQVPYRDFEFFYGPSMIYGLWGWAQVFGPSLKSYYSFLATQEAVQFAILTVALQLTITDRRWRILVFIILAPILVDTMLGLNWSAGRRLIAVFALLLAAARPFDLRANIAVGVIVGLYATYSHEYAAATLVGIGAMYGAALLGPDRLRSLRSGPVVAATTLLTYAIGIYALLGTGWRDYLAAVRRVVGVMSQGHLSFEFYWTVNSIALFAVLAIAIVGLGAALPRFRERAFSGDLLLVGAVGFALVTLKSGLNRADHWHLGAAFLPLFFVFLTDMPRRAVHLSKGVDRAAVVLIAVASATYLVGIYPTGRYYADSFYLGARDIKRGVPTAAVDQADFRDISTEPERSYADPTFSAIGRYLGAPERAHRPVLYYGRAWAASPRIGVCPQDYKMDALMYSANEFPEWAFLQQNPESYVVMVQRDYARVFGLKDPESTRERPFSMPKWLASWLATVHFRQGPLEHKLLNAVRDSATGTYVREHYELVDVSDPIARVVLLQPKSAP